MQSATPVIEVENLVVEYGRGRKRKRVLKGISLEVRQGECVGFIGVNGAGKSTTIKSLMGFLFPASGSIRIFGAEAGTVESRRRTGYLPEVSQYYPFMKARELLDLYGGLHGLSRRELKERIPRVLETVGLAKRSEDLLKSFSKGMQQRLGIAQAIIAEPDLLIFDELSSGLDPLGRHDLRDVLSDLKRQGRTIFFSSHELTEVESLCDSIVVIHDGEIVTRLTAEELMAPLKVFEIAFDLPGGRELPEGVRELAPVRHADALHIRTNDEKAYAKALAELASCGAEVRSTDSHLRNLEDYFIDIVTGREARR